MSKVLWITIGLVVLTAGVMVRVNGLQSQVVLTGSMRPTIQPGDLVITDSTPVSQLAVGDVIAFFPPGEPQAVLHRIATLTVEDAGSTVTTRGDANSMDDPWRATLRGDTAYRLAFVVPLIGWLTELRGLPFIAAGLLVALMVFRELRRKEIPLISGPRTA